VEAALQRAWPGELYDLSNDPAELINLFDDPAFCQVRMHMVEELLTWTIRTEDDLPSAQYIPKRAEHNWYARYRDAYSPPGQDTPRWKRRERLHPAPASVSHFPRYL
jgi:hypothetical protein